MAGGAAESDVLYVSGLVAMIFSSPTWVTPIAGFVDENCGIFEDPSGEARARPGDEAERESLPLGGGEPSDLAWSRRVSSNGSGAE